MLCLLPGRCTGRAAAAALAGSCGWHRKRPLAMVAGGGGRRAGSAAAAAAAAPPANSSVNTHSRTSSTTMSQMTAERFDSLPVSDALTRGIRQSIKYDFMTKVQAATIPVSLTGADVLAKAKTGTGKTLAFLIPCMERTLQAAAAQRGGGGRGGGISVLVISPSRELAKQIHDEAEPVARALGLHVQVVFGGTNINADLRRLAERPPHILVATPGRLNDHLANQNLAPKFAHMCSLVLDEADQLLEMGFRPAIEAALRRLPPPTSRQTLLFSATMPADVRAISKVAMREDYRVVDTVGEEESTHEHVQQSYVTTTMEGLAPQLLSMLKNAVAEGDGAHKVIVFFTTARLTQLYAELFNALGVPVLEIHSRKSQPQRTKVSHQFRSSKGLTMFTSDVSARGMDYPDVTHVIQVGMPSNRDQYIHRLGRTARAGKGGRGVLLLCEFERPFLREVRDLPITQEQPAQVAPLEASVRAALARVPEATKNVAYQANLGFLNGQLKRLKWSKEQLVAVVNDWACRALGLSQPPMINAMVVGKMGLKKVPGLRVESGPSSGGGVGRRAGWRPPSA